MYKNLKNQAQSRQQYIENLKKQKKNYSISVIPQKQSQTTRNINSVKNIDFKEQFYSTNQHQESEQNEDESFCDNSALLYQFGNEQHSESVTSSQGTTKAIDQKHKLFGQFFESEKNDQLICNSIENDMESGKKIDTSHFMKQKNVSSQYDTENTYGSVQKVSADKSNIDFMHTINNYLSHFSSTDNDKTQNKGQKIPKQSEKQQTQISENYKKNQDVEDLILQNQMLKTEVFNLTNSLHELAQNQKLIYQQIKKSKKNDEKHEFIIKSQKYEIKYFMKMMQDVNQKYLQAKEQLKIEQKQHNQTQSLLNKILKEKYFIDNFLTYFISIQDSQRNKTKNSIQQTKKPSLKQVSVLYSELSESFQDSNHDISNSSIEYPQDPSPPFSHINSYLEFVKNSRKNSISPLNSVKNVQNNRPVLQNISNQTKSKKTRSISPISCDMNNYKLKNFEQFEKMFNL